MNPKIYSKKNNIIFDVDSSTVAGGLFEFGYDQKGNCINVRELSSVRKNITNGTQYSFEEYWRRTQQIFTEVVEETHLQSLIPVENVYCNVSAPWSSAQKREVIYTKKKPFVLTKELADKLIEKEVGSSLKKNLDYHKHDVVLIDRKTIAVYGNGYPARNPIGKEMSDVKIDSLITVMSEGTKNTFDHIIEQSFHRGPIFTSNIFIAYHDIQKSLPDYNDSIVIDVAGEMTEVMIVKKDHLELIGTFPCGINAVIRETARVLDINISKTRKHISLLYAGSLGEDYGGQVQKALKQSYQIWLREFYNFCDDSSKQGLLPNTIILKTYADVMSWFESLLLGSDELSEHIHARASIELVHLHAKRKQEKIALDIFDPDLRVIAHTIAFENL